MCCCSGSASSTEAFVTKYTESILGTAFLGISIVCNSRILSNIMWCITCDCLEFADKFFESPMPEMNQCPTGQNDFLDSTTAILAPWEFKKGLAPSAFDGVGSLAPLQPRQLGQPCGKESERERDREEEEEGDEMR